MPSIKNYDKNESLATGFVKPKITSLFFDKIWLPKSLVAFSREFYDIPREVLIIEQTELELEIDSVIKSGNHYLESTKQNIPYTSGEYYSIMMQRNDCKPVVFDLYSNDNDLRSVFSKSDFDEPHNYRFSKNRNNAIFVSAENFCRKYNLHISPIFHDLTEFEKEIQLIRQQDLQKNSALQNTIRRPNTLTNKNVLAICIQDFPSIIEEELSWEQVLDIRKDNKNRERIKRFTQWSSRRFKKMSPDEIRETLEYELEEYKKALKEHGIKTLVGSFSTLISSASSLRSILENSQEALLPLLAIVSVSITFSVNTYYSNLKNKNNPIAYLYELTNE